MRLISKFTLPKIIGHRGVKDLAPENSIESISKAFELGLDCVEIDVKISKDNIENYRPISLTSLVMKTFESILRQEILLKLQTY